MKSQDLSPSAHPQHVAFLILFLLPLSSLQIFFHFCFSFFLPLPSAFLSLHSTFTSFDFCFVF